MKKILLILAITFVGLVDAQEIKKPYFIEQFKVQGTYMWVICVQNYVFIKPVGNSLTQFMHDKVINTMTGELKTEPMRCEDYKKTS